MHFTIEKHANLPCYFTTFSSDFDLKKDTAASQAGVVAVLNSVSEPIYFIQDLRAIQPSFDDLLAVIGDLRQQMAVIHHPMLIEWLIVVPNRMVEMMIKGVASTTFGHMPMRPFTNVEAAVAYVQEQVKRKAD